jgi:hypothetical protein
MKAAFAHVLVGLVLVAFLGSCFVPLGLAQDTTRTFLLADPSEGAFSYTLNVVVPQSLVNYYQGLSHRIISDGSFPKYATPYAVKPIADALRQLYSDDEDFVNGVLTFVHQIPYKETTPEFYPVETLSRDMGDCDMFSLLAASIIKAGGLDVVLMHYQSQAHMNIAVHLNSSPQDARSDVYAFKNNNQTYYVAECTTSNWKSGWRVGECPSDLKNVAATIIGLQNSEQIAPGQVSASFKKLQETTLEVQVSPIFATEGTTITVQGQISPDLANQVVTLYLSSLGSSWNLVTTVVTQANGEFTYSWKSEAAGSMQVRASWAGNDQYAGTTSPAQNMLILPVYLLVLFAVAAAAVATCTATFMVLNKRKRLPQSEIENSIP